MLLLYLIHIISFSNIPDIGPVAADWQIAAGSLLTGALDLDVNVIGNGLKVKGHANITQQQVQLSDADVFLSTSHLAPILRQGRARLAGDFEVNKLNAAFNIQDKQILNAEGRLIFTGGDVSFPVDGKPVNATLPMLVGKLSKPADNVELSLTTTEGAAIGSGYLQPDGWGGVAIKRRFLDILGQKWPKDVDEETVIFEVSQKLL